MLLSWTVLAFASNIVNATRDEIIKCREQLSASEIWVMSDGVDYVIMSAIDKTVKGNGTKITHIGNVSTVLLQTQMQYLHQFYSVEDSPWVELYRVISFHWKNPIFWVGIAMGLLFACLSVSTIVLFIFIYLNHVSITCFMRQFVQNWHSYLKITIRSLPNLTSQPLDHDSISMTQGHYN